MYRMLKIFFVPQEEFLEALDKISLPVLSSPVGLTGSA